MNVEDSWGATPVESNGFTLATDGPDLAPMFAAIEAGRAASEAGDRP